MSNKKYEINEKDIDTVIGILKRIAPENATPEMAIAILEHYQATFHELGHIDPEALEKLYKDFLKEQKTKN